MAQNIMPAAALAKPGVTAPVPVLIVNQVIPPPPEGAPSASAVVPVTAGVTTSQTLVQKNLRRRYLSILFHGPGTLYVLLGAGDADSRLHSLKFSADGDFYEMPVRGNDGFAVYGGSIDFQFSDATATAVITEV